jgi:plasmid stabilization system protein ParE
VTISIQPSALSDLKSGFHFYESQDRGLGDYFLDTLYSDIDSLQLYAGIHSIHFGHFHRLLSKRFPYGIYYQIGEHAVLIKAVLDLRRDPNWVARKINRLA